MKKIIIILLLALFCAGIASAQIVRSQSRSVTLVSEPKGEHQGNWIVKAGGGLMGSDNRTFGKYSVMVGYQRQFEKNGLYWGVQAGLNSFCYTDYSFYDNDYDRGSAPAQSLGPTIGLKRALGSETTFDTHIGIQYAHMFEFDGFQDDKNRFVWEFGIGIWYKSFLIELEYQGSQGWATDHGMLLNLGVKF